ncbi:MAG: hypothetical protein AB1428_10635 [Bacteroidota bacterium]
MKTFSVLVFAAAIVCAGNEARAQFKGQIEREMKPTGELITQQSAPSLLFGWFDPNRFMMHHSINLSYQTIGGQGMTLGTYTNSMLYRFADNLDARADISMSYSPYNSFATFNGKGGKDFSGLYLSRAQLTYRPWENVTMQLQYRQLPYGYYYYSPFYHPWYGENGF